MDDRENRAACALNRVFGYEPRTALGLVERLGSAAAVFDLPQKERDALTGPFGKHAGELTVSLLDDCARELEALERMGCRFIAYTDPAYPELLRDCEDPPAGLYYRSDSPPEEIFAKRPAIAVVGTRDMSPYGREWCTRLVGAMAQAPSKPVIISGLAFGVDITAHMAALGHGLSTVAVLPGGIDDIYPKRHAAAAGKIAAAPGSALVTDYPPGTAPAAFTFLRRNRIIAALSNATVLIESKIHGGGLITARLASGYGREVFALPGRIDDVRSAGCNLLIGEKLAEPLTDLSRAGEQLGLGRYNLRREADFRERVKEVYRSLPEDRRNALLAAAEAVRKRRGITVDELCAALGKPYPETAALAGTLESDGIIGIDLLQRCTIIVKNA